jgi:hypothetical protein
LQEKSIIAYSTSIETLDWSKLTSVQNPQKVKHTYEGLECDFIEKHSGLRTKIVEIGSTNFLKFLSICGVLGATVAQNNPKTKKALQNMNYFSLEIYF